MTILCASGRATVIPEDDTVFVPLGIYNPGESIDPETVRFITEPAQRACQPGGRIILDNRVETVARVA